ncbi:hypothetical protein ZHAS_00004682 [Anopheles sinensis]|uniref:Uncharacterized protein n=1 Tax=Anopheles sinensis TaxID=74873 RepID=A0A084VHE0_ANOSI|nr:hypothetical protein ZHAS_00004682 [Anopheles sinensis]
MVGGISASNIKRSINIQAKRSHHLLPAIGSEVEGNGREKSFPGNWLHLKCTFPVHDPLKLTFTHWEGAGGVCEELTSYNPGRDQCNVNQHRSKRCTKDIGFTGSLPKDV